jgi:hypothetical protein
MSNSQIWAINEAAAQADPRSGARRSLLRDAEYEESQYSGVIPDQSSTYYRPGEDAYYHGGIAGDQAVALAAVVRQTRRGVAARTVAPAGDGQTIALAASEVHSHEHSHFGDADHSHAHLAAGKSAFSVPDEVQRYTDMAKREFGAAEDEMNADPTDDRQPKKGGKTYPGVNRSGFGAEDQAAINSYFESLKGRLADTSMFGQRTKGSCFSGHGSGRAGGYE